MKTFLLAFMALMAMQVAAHAANTSTASDQQQLVPADQLAQEDGLNLSTSDDTAEGAADSLLHPPPYPYPHPHPVPPPYHPPYPHPVPPPYPYPHPVPPPPSYWYECSSQDNWGNIYTERGGNPVYTQRDVHNSCEYNSGSYCTDLGCRRYY